MRRQRHLGRIIPSTPASLYDMQISLAGHQLAIMNSISTVCEVVIYVDTSLIGTFKIQYFIRTRLAAQEWVYYQPLPAI
jgi:hypothetical protein